MGIKIENAIIESTMLGRDDHGIMTVSIGIKGDGWGCGFGGYALDEWSETEKKRVGTAYGLQFIMQVLDVVGVDKWEDLKGKHLRVENEGWGGRILRVGNIIENKWFEVKK